MPEIPLASDIEISVGILSFIADRLCILAQTLLIVLHCSNHVCRGAESSYRS